MSTKGFVSTNEIRDMFSRAMSELYRMEVPLYGDLIKLVEQVNRQYLDSNNGLSKGKLNQDERSRLSVERHGAIRVGTANELRTLNSLFAVMGMYPVGYYDLAQAGLPVHSTAFRPIEKEALVKNPFRVFTSLLRLDLIEDAQLRRQAEKILSERNIFTSNLVELIELNNLQGGLDEEQAKRFVSEALQTFRWHPQSTVDFETYIELRDTHRLIADIVCFKGPHINHLTPRTLDIDAAQRRMPDMGMSPKSIIEGPPKRQCPILLRQTSFQALSESIRFKDGKEGRHTARFGEIEQRGAALTAKGRALYDHLLSAARKRGHGLDNDAYQQVLNQTFDEFPDDLTELRKQGLAFFEYRLTDKARNDQVHDVEDLEKLVEDGFVHATPITYEDFLPVSAAGIFQSNLDGKTDGETMRQANRSDFEVALGTRVINELELYDKQQKESARNVLQALLGHKAAKRNT